MAAIPKEITDKYEVLQNAFRQVVKDDPKDRLEVEIGDVKQPDTFYPQVKIMRWDNEVNASFRLIDDEPKTLTTEGEKIKLVGDKKEIHFYDIAPCEEHPEGGYEFEVVLKVDPRPDKKGDYVLEFSIETKGLSFSYQPPLTQEVGKRGIVTATDTQGLDKDGNVIAERPENVVGSYAVYHKTKRSHILGQKNYRTGKALHIYRPKIYDANDNWVWGELNIDVNVGIQTITIPQDFIDNATYPIKHASGEVFGYDTLGSSSNSWTTDTLRGRVDSPTSSGTVTSLHLGCYDSGDNFKLALYKESDNSLVASTDAGSAPASKAWVQLDASGTVVALTDYVIAFFMGTPISVAQDSNGASNKYQEGTYPTLPSPANFSASGDPSNYSIYATYEAAAEGPSVVGYKSLLGVGQG